MSVEVQGMKQAFKALESYVDGSADDIEKEVNTALIDTERKAKHKVPVDTGRLRSSIHHNHTGLEGFVLTNVEYASDVEHGTYKQQAQPFMFPAWEEVRTDFVKAVSKILNR